MNANEPVGGSGARWQFIDGRGNMMLNSDMCFVKDIEPDAGDGRWVNSSNYFEGFVVALCTKTPHI